MAITKAELQEKYDYALARIERMKQDEREFKSRLVTIAAEAAYDHDLCEVLEETLDKIGVEVPDVEVIVQTETLYKMSLIEAHRLGFLAEDSDLKDAVNNWIGWDAPDAEQTQVNHVTIKQPETQAA